MSMSLKRYIVQTQDNDETEELEVREDKENLYFDHSISENLYSFIYKKEKDICMMLKNGKPINETALTQEELEWFEDVRCVAINIEHERDVDYLN